MSMLISSRDPACWCTKKKRKRKKEREKARVKGTVKENETERRLQTGCDELIVDL